jgi:hypothetical protein
MADLKLLDRVFYLITQHFIVTGQAPHYTELAKALSLSVEESRRLLHELMEAPYPSGTYPGWFHPGTDYIVSFAPFNNLSTQYRITIDGQQKWFANEMNLKALSYWADRFSAEKYKARARTDHFSWCAENFSTAPLDQSTRKEK